MFSTPVVKTDICRGIKTSTGYQYYEYNDWFGKSVTIFTPLSYPHQIVYNTRDVMDALKTKYSILVKLMHSRPCTDGIYKTKKVLDVITYESLRKYKNLNYFMTMEKCLEVQVALAEYRHQTKQENLRLYTLAHYTDDPTTLRHLHQDLYWNHWSTQLYYNQTYWEEVYRRFQLGLMYDQQNCCF